MSNLYWTLLRKWQLIQEAYRETRDLKILKKVVDSLGWEWTKRLTDRELIVVVDRLGGLTLEETARNLGVTRERIRQMQSKALRKLQKEAGVK